MARTRPRRTGTTPRAAAAALLALLALGGLAPRAQEAEGGGGGRACAAHGQACCGLVEELRRLQENQNGITSNIPSSFESFRSLKQKHDHLLGLVILLKGTQEVERLNDEEKLAYTLVKMALDNDDERNELLNLWSVKRRAAPNDLPGHQAFLEFACHERRAPNRCRALRNHQSGAKRQWDLVAGGILSAYVLAAGENRTSLEELLTDQDLEASTRELADIRRQIAIIQTEEPYTGFEREKETALSELQDTCNLNPDHATTAVFCETNDVSSSPFGEMRTFAGGVGAIVARLESMEQARRVRAEETERRREERERDRRMLEEGRPGTGTLLAGAVAQSMPNIAQTLVMGLHRPNYDYFLHSALASKNWEYLQNAMRDRTPDFFWHPGAPPCHPSFCGGHSPYFNPFFGDGLTGVGITGGGITGGGLPGSGPTGVGITGGGWSDGWSPALPPTPAP